MSGSSVANGSNVPIGHLDYNYVKDCTNAKELEEIIMVLRSGKEGYYPDLVEFSEKKLKEINPKSEVLRHDKPAPSVNDLDADEKKAVNEEFLDWMNKASDMDKKLQNSTGQAETNNVDGLPPVRSKKTMANNVKTEKVVKPSTSNSKQQVKPRDYKEWDKFDIDKELENMDKKEDMDKKEELKSELSNGKSSIKIQPVPTKDQLSAEERLFHATKEKDKGNEAFRAQDYDEAILYYTISLKYEPTAASYNNRAAAELKIEKYSEAIQDCNKVFELEPKNIKALLRRGMAFKALKQYEKAVKDFNSMLQEDPNNKRAEDLLAEIKDLKRVTEPVKSEVKDVTANGDPKQESENEETGTKAKKKGQRLKIVEIDSTDDVIAKNGAEPSAVGSGNEQNGEDDQVAERDLETSKGVSKDITVINGGKQEQGGLSMDKKVNSESLLSEDDLSKNKGVVMESGAGNDGDTMAEGELRNEATGESGDGSGDSLNGSEASQQCPLEKEVVLELPEEVKCWMREGNDLYKMGHHSDALEKYSRCVERLWPDRESYTSAVSGLLNNKAACYFKLGDCKQCVLECNQSLQLIENNVKALLRRGSAFETMEKYAEAFKDFNRVRFIDGTNKVALEHCSRVIKLLEAQHGTGWRKQIFEMSGADDIKQQTLPDAAKTGNRNLAKATHDTTSPQKPRVHADSEPNARGVTKESRKESEAEVKARFLKLKESGNSLVKKVKHEEAVKCYAECIKLCPEEVAGYTNRALCYLQLSQYEQAETDCNTALKIETDNIKALFRRGKARKGLGRYRDASEDLVQVLKLDSKNVSARSELTEVLGLLKKEKKDEEKTQPKRKRILIQDVAGNDDKNSSKSTQKHSQASTRKRKETAAKTHQKDDTKAKEQTPKHIPKETTKTKEDLNRRNAKTSSTTPRKLNVKSAFQFFQAWKSVKNNEAFEYLNILKQVNLTELPKVISNRLDADMIESMFEALHIELLSNGGDVKFVFEFLKKLILVERFEMTLMFLLESDKKVLRTVFDGIKKQNTEQTGIDDKELSELKQKYRV